MGLKTRIASSSVANTILAEANIYYYYTHESDQSLRVKIRSVHALSLGLGGTLYPPLRK